MANDLSSSPWWVKAIVTVGVPSAIALYVVWFITGQLSTTVGLLQVGQAGLQESIRMHTADSSYIFKETQEMRQLLQQICANTAENEVNRNACFQ